MRFFCLRSMQQMSEDKHGLESVPAWIETNGLLKKKEKENYMGSETTPYIN